MYYQLCYQRYIQSTSSHYYWCSLVVLYTNREWSCTGAKGRLLLILYCILVFRVTSINYMLLQETTDYPPWNYWRKSWRKIGLEWFLISNSTKQFFLCWPSIVPFATLHTFCRSPSIRNCVYFHSEWILCPLAAKLHNYFILSVCVYFFYLCIQFCLHTIYIFHVACKMPVSLSTSFSAVYSLKSHIYIYIYIYILD